MRLASSLLLLLLVCVPACGSAQVVDLGKDRVPMSNLSGPWRFHTGDDAAWSNPGFDDGQWSLLRADEGWSRQGHPGYSGVAWYRLQVVLPAEHGALALYIPNVDVSCQVFANGRLIGEIGGLPPQPRYIEQSRTVFAIPDDLARGGRLMVALRVWLDPRLASSRPGGLHPAPRMGDAQAIAQWRRLEGRELYWENSASIIELFANLLGVLACGIVFAMRRKEREYFWFGLYLLNWSIFHVAMLYSAFRPVPYFAFSLLVCVLLGLGPFANAAFFVALARQPRGWLYAGASFFAIAAAGAVVLDDFEPHHLWNIAQACALTVYWVCLAAILRRAWKTGIKDVAILLAPVAWGLAEAVLFALAHTPAFTQDAWAQGFLDFMAGGTRWPFPYVVPSLVGDLTNVVVLVVLIRRYANSRRDEERFESEMEAAHTVQQAHIPDELPAIPGYLVQAVYKPASHVGGDFFQIIPLDGGGALVAIGDVSGKGMPAAMTVSLLVGTFRTLAHYTHGPGEILRAMNQRLLARSNAGFVTCLVMRLYGEGMLTLANAGHLPPYLNSRELQLEPALPLGISADADYPEMTLTMPQNGRLTLMTDGVVEAMSATGELLGFDRAAGLSKQSAEEIARAAQEFGQQDDITVLTVTRELSPALVA
jgi:hypothetical protein